MEELTERNSANRPAKKSNVLVVGLIIIVLAVLAIGMIGFLFLKPKAEIIQGQAEATSVRISGKLPGRIVEFMVEEGQSVKKGDTLVHIISTTLDAKLEQAMAMEQVATQQNKKVDAGARKQMISAAYDLWKQAEAAVEITKKTYQRMEALNKKGVISTQKRDEAKAAFDASTAQCNAAKSQYEMAKEGAQIEDKNAAAAMVNAAKGSVNEVKALLEDQYLVAPYDGEISDIYPNVSELIMTGAPIMSLLRMDDMWVTFSVREDLLKDMKMGAEIIARIPALGDKKVNLKIYYIRDMGTYAVWRATKTTGQYDAKTFQIKARSSEPIPDFRPGMSVIVEGFNNK